MNENQLNWNFEWDAGNYDLSYVREDIYQQARFLLEKNYIEILAITEEEIQFKRNDVGQGKAETLKTTIKFPVMNAEEIAVYLRCLQEKGESIETITKSEKELKTAYERIVTVESNRYPFKYPFTNLFLPQINHVKPSAPKKAGERVTSSSKDLEVLLHLHPSFWERSDEDYELASRLQKYGYVKSGYDDDTKWCYIRYPLEYPASILSVEEKNVKDLPDYCVCKTVSYPDSPNKPDDFDIFHLAGFVDYLRRTFQYENFLHRRKIELDRLEEAKQVDNAISFGKDTNRLACTIEGNNTQEMDKKIEEIKKHFRGEFPITKMDVPVLDNYGQPVLDDYGNKQNKTEPNDPILHLQMEKFAIDVFPWVGGGMTPRENSYLSREVLLGKVFVILDELSNFFGTEHDGDPVKVQRFHKIVEWFAVPHPDTYLIVRGTPEEMSQFYKLDTRIVDIFEKNRIVVKNLVPLEMYDVYRSELKENLLTHATPEFFSEFEDHLVQYGRGFDAENHALAEQLANYSNEHSTDETGLILQTNDYTTLEELQNRMVGMDTLKKQLESLGKTLKLRRKRELEGLKNTSQNLHMFFTGNPGTGKTTVAKMVAQLLYQMGYLTKTEPVVVGREDLVGQYVGSSAKQTADVIARAMGGVLFIDEAYALTPSDKQDYGHEVISTLVRAMEVHKEELVVIFAGYEKEMDEFRRVNPGLTSRITKDFHFRFPDYKPEELVEIACRLLKSQGYEYENPQKEKNIYSKLLSVCTDCSTRPNFGNGRFVDNLVAKIESKVAERCFSDENNNGGFQILEETDIPDALEMSSSDRRSADSEDIFANIVGLNDVKEKLESFSNMAKLKKHLVKIPGTSLPNSHFHMLFHGNPGTGKTTVAKKVAQYLFEIGLISDNKVICVERKDLIAEYLGQTAIKTNDVIQRAMGGVLFIDEAYSLVEKNPLANCYGEEAIATLITAMEDHKDNLVVIFAGYEKEMDEFVNTNPGISSRIGFNFHFQDYNADELYAMFDSKLTKHGFTLSSDNEGDPVEKLKQLFQFFCHVENFGNGRFVDKVLTATMSNHASKLTELREEQYTTIFTSCIPDKTQMATVMQDANIRNLVRLLENEEKLQESLYRTAVHEIGHAILQYRFFPEQAIKKITISAEGTGALGYVQMDSSDELHRTQGSFRNQIAVFLAGLAAEEILLTEYASGGTSDLEQAMKIAELMIR